MKKIIVSAVSLGLFCAGLQPAFASDTQSTRQMALQYVLQQDIMRANGDGDFLSDAPVTKIELLDVVLDRVYVRDDPSSCYAKIASVLPPQFTLLFRDVAANASYARRICVGMVAGLISGDDRGNFHPFAPISTAEASKILSRAFGVYTIGSTEPTGAPWYQTYMWVLRQEGALPASADDALHRLTRGELAEMLYALRHRSVVLSDDAASAAGIIARVNGGSSDASPIRPTPTAHAPVIQETTAASPLRTTGTIGESPRSEMRLPASTEAVRRTHHGATREPTIRGVPLSDFYSLTAPSRPFYLRGGLPFSRTSSPDVSVVAVLRI